MSGTAGTLAHSAPLLTTPASTEADQKAITAAVAMNTILDILFRKDIDFNDPHLQLPALDSTLQNDLETWLENNRNNNEKPDEIRLLFRRLFEATPSLEIWDAYKRCNLGKILLLIKGFPLKLIPFFMTNDNHLSATNNGNTNNRVSLFPSQYTALHVHQVHQPVQPAETKLHQPHVANSKQYIIGADAEVIRAAEEVNKILNIIFSRNTNYDGALPQLDPNLEKDLKAWLEKNGDCAGKPQAISILFRRLSRMQELSSKPRLFKAFTHCNIINIVCLIKGWPLPATPSSVATHDRSSTITTAPAIVPLPVQQPLPRLFGSVIAPRFNAEAKDPVPPEITTQPVVTQPTLPMPLPATANTTVAHYNTSVANSHNYHLLFQQPPPQFTPPMYMVFYSGGKLLMTPPTNYPGVANPEQQQQPAAPPSFGY